ncbi:hypothetical protein M3J09_000195 [Ascochyta lentis]
MTSNSSRSLTANRADQLVFTWVRLAAFRLVFTRPLRDSVALFAFNVPTARRSGVVGTHPIAQHRRLMTYWFLTVAPVSAEREDRSAPKPPR